jgi:MerR HTH family regulatory protein
MEYSLAHLAVMTGLKPRTVQVWAEAGAIKPSDDTDRQGTGMHRRFSFEEAIIACILAPLSMLKMSIGTLLQVAANVRNIKTSLPKHADVMNNDVPHVLVIRWFNLEEDGGGIMCTIRPSRENAAAVLAEPDEVKLEIPLRLILAGLRRFK